jgi:hypothetical protein
MKKLLPFLFLAIVLGSCSKGGNDPAPAPAPTNNSHPILGQWFPVNTVTVITTSSGQASTYTMDYLNRAVSEVYTATDVTAYLNQSATGPAHPYTLSSNICTISDGSRIIRQFEIETLTSSSFVQKYTSTNGTSTSVSMTTLVR